MYPEFPLGTTIYFVQPWKYNSYKHSWNHKLIVPKTPSFFLIGQYHTHPGSSYPGPTDFTQSWELGMPVITIGKDKRAWEIDAQNNGKQTTNGNLYQYISSYLW